MSRLPHYLYLRKAISSLGNLELYDGLKEDGMKDFFEKKYMGECAEKIAAELGISRKE